MPLLALHASISLPVTLVVVARGYRAEGAARARANRAVHWWSRTLLRIFGITVVRKGQPLPEPVLLVANHSSWADIEVIHAEVPAGFVAKAEIARWPIIGFMAKVGGSVFHHRGSGSSGARVVEAMAQRLREGRSVAIFPEGRTGPGRPVLPFHGRLLQAAIDTDTPIQAVAIRFVRNGDYDGSIAFRDGENFVQSVLRMLGQPPAIAELHFLEPRTAAGEGRSELARALRQQVVSVVEA